MYNLLDLYDYLPLYLCACFSFGDKGKIRVCKIRLVVHIVILLQLPLIFCFNRKLNYLESSKRM